MNILIPHQWLLEHLDTAATPAQIQTELSLAGPSIERIYDRAGESVYDIEVTTNRVDSFCVRGIAREAAIILSQAGINSQLKPLSIAPIPTATTKLPLPEIIDHASCRRIMTVVLSNLHRAPTPSWMADRLRQTDQNVHDAAIDITNYITHELGYPCHAFDYDKIMQLGGVIKVISAEPNQPFTTLDGETYHTKGGEIVFVNQDNIIIDLPGIKGTANTAVDANTTNILFWLESIDAQLIRFASMSHAIRTTAAQINEKKPDPNLMPVVLQKGVALYQELCQAQVASEVVDLSQTLTQPLPITVPVTTITDYLGLVLDQEQLITILSALECQVDVQDQQLLVTPPSFRPDLTIPADVVEEVARIYGYHRLPSQIMATPIPLVKPEQVDFHLEHRIKQFLADHGWQEIYTFSMVSAELATNSGLPLTDHLKLQNPLTDDRVYLRRSLIPSHEEAIQQNPQHPDLAVFELAHVYLPAGDQLPHQVLELTLTTTQTYRHLRGMIEGLLAMMHIPSTNFAALAEPDPQFAYQAVVTTAHQDELVKLGHLGVLKSGRTAATLQMKSLVQVAQTHPSYTPAAKTNSIIEDLTFTFPDQTPIGPVLTAITTINQVKVATLKDTYRRNQTFQIVYHDSTSDLNADLVEPIRTQVVELVEHQFAGQLVGTL